MLENEIKLCLTKDSYYEIKNTFFINNNFKKSYKSITIMIIKIMTYIKTI